MLLRIAPTMFQDARFECVTIQAVRKELLETRKFKGKYPWLKSETPHDQCLPSSVTESTEVKQRYDVITQILELGVEDKQTGRYFDLSKEDRLLVSTALEHGYLLSSGDGGINRFAKQEFPKQLQGLVSALDLVNRWIEGDLIKWDDSKHALIAEWAMSDEHSQPAKSKSTFKALTGKPYPGT